MQKFIVLVMITGSVLLPSVTSAGDGMIEINQAVALAGGVNGSLASDPAGFPVTITEPGSYILTGNLDVPDENTTAIQIEPGASRSTINLNGFAIRGDTSCSFVTGVCNPTGAGAGIQAASTAIGIRVHNGIITGMGGNGMQLRGHAAVRGLQAISNGGAGIEVGGRSSIVESQAIFNGGAGIRIADATGSLSSVGESVLADNLSVKNGIENNGALDIEGSRTTSGNVCSDGSCSARGARRFYLTSSLHDGSEALQACADGFHMASLWEIYDISNLEYTRTPRSGVSAAVTDDSGEGPPTGMTGWVRTGNDSSGSSQPGVGNCEVWSNVGSLGTILTLNGLWDTDPAAGEFEFWSAGGTECSVTIRVWCVEN